MTQPFSGTLWCDGYRRRLPYDEASLLRRSFHFNAAVKKADEGEEISLPV